MKMFRQHSAELFERAALGLDRRMEPPGASLLQRRAWAEGPRVHTDREGECVPWSNEVPPLRIPKLTLEVLVDGLSPPARISIIWRRWESGLPPKPPESLAEVVALFVRVDLLPVDFPRENSSHP